MPTNKDLPKEERQFACDMPTAVFNNDYSKYGNRPFLSKSSKPWCAWVRDKEIGHFSTFSEAIHVADWHARHPNPLSSDRRPDYSPDSPHWGQPHEDCCK